MAANCEHCQNLLLDYLYGLLEGEELQTVREHLNVCSECTAALEKGQAQMSLLSDAARAIRAVPEFAVPQDAPALLPLAEVAAPAAPTSQPRRAFWRRPWVAWSAAAALFLTISGTISYYRHTINSYDQELARARQESTQVVQALAALPAKYQPLQQAALRATREEAPLYLHVDGPTQLQPGTKGSLDITTKQIDGSPAPGNIVVKLTDADSNELVQLAAAQSPGHVRVELDAARAKPNSKLKVAVETQTALGSARVQHSITVPPPQYVARLDTSKIAYQAREVLFFRVLVLDRQTLKPPSQPVPLQVKLRSPSGATVKQFWAATGPGGILAGELPIEDHYVAGTYVLSVEDSLRESGLAPSVAVVALAGAPMTHAPLLAASTLVPAKSEPPSVQAVAQRLEILRNSPIPSLQFDKDSYLPGEAFTAIVPGGLPPGDAKLIVGDKAVPFTMSPLVPGFGGMGGGGAGGLGTQNAIGNPTGPTPKKKTATSTLTYLAAATANRRITANVPKDVPAGAKNLPVTLQYQKGPHKTELRARLPLQPTDYAIDLFPEGGDLIAGVPNRVFYRVRSRNGAPVTSDGRVILLSSKNEIVDSRYQLGLGYVDFTPNAKETYTLRITSPVKTTEVPNAFHKLGIRPVGVVLHVSAADAKPAAVGKQGEPVRVTLRNQGPARKLLVIAQCRGQVLDQGWLDVKNGSQDLTLQTGAARGMVRVTAYELADGALQPVAERLVYRTSAQAVNLGLALNTQQHQPGKKLEATLKATDGKGQPAPAWMLAVVVDARFQPAPRSLSAYFLLLNEMRTGADLDQAQIILNDNPQAAPMLECFLGTHGWRRFVSTPGAMIASAPLIFSQENAPLETLQEQYLQRQSERIAAITKIATQEQFELRQEQLRLSTVIGRVLEARIGFESRVMETGRLAVAGLLALLLLAGLVLMAIGLYRIVRRHKVASPAFGGAFACFAVCLLAMFIASQVGPLPVSGPLASAWDNVANIDHGLEFAAPPLKLPGRPTPVGEYALQAPRANNKARWQDQLARDDNQNGMRDGSKQEEGTHVLAMKDQKADRLLAEVEQAAPKPMLANAQAENKAMAKAFDKAKARGAANMQERQKADEKKTLLAPAAPIALPKAAQTAEKGDADSKNKPSSFRTEYAHEHAPHVMADTLLWSPTLWLANGTAVVRFDLASGQATYRVLLLAHTPDGALGFYETRLDVPPFAEK